MIGLALKRDYVGLRKRIIEIPKIYWDEVALRIERSNNKREISAIQKQLYLLDNPPHYEQVKNPEDKKEEKRKLKKLLKKALADRDHIFDRIDCFVRANKDELIFIEETSSILVSASGDCEPMLLEIPYTEGLSCRTFYRQIDFKSPASLLIAFSIRDWEVNGFPKEWKPDQRQRAIAELEEALESTIVIAPSLLREERGLRKRLYELCMHEKRSGLCWLFARPVLYEFMDYYRAGLAESIGLQISPYRATASCITDKAFLKALDVNTSIASTMPYFKNHKVVLNRSTIDSLIYKSLGIEVEPEHSDTTYAVTYTKKKKELSALKIKGKKVE